MARESKKNSKLGALVFLGRTRKFAIHRNTVRTVTTLESVSFFQSKQTTNTINRCWMEKTQQQRRRYNSQMGRFFPFGIETNKIVCYHQIDVDALQKVRTQNCTWFEVVLALYYNSSAKQGYGTARYEVYKFHFFERRYIRRDNHHRRWFNYEKYA